MHLDDDKKLIILPDKRIYMKGVAVPYIIALLIGIIVLTIAVYLIYVYVVHEPPLECQKCRALFASWCSKCYLQNWDGENKIVGTDLEQCVKDCNLYTTPKNDCSHVDTKNACKGVGVPP